VSRDEMEAPPAPGERRVQVGVTKAVDLDVDLSSLRPGNLSSTPRPLSHGAIRANGRRGFTWTGVVESPGASALRLHFVNFFLPRNGELYLYSDEGEVVGPYTGRGPHADGEFWSHTLRGSRLTLQLSYRGGDTAGALRATRFVVADVGHLDERFVLGLLGPAAGARAGEGLCPGNAACIENASCSTLDPAISPARDAVALILFESRSGPLSGLFICSGGLVNDTDEGSVRSYFLTANHCISRDREARSAETFFHYTTPCNGSCGGLPVESTLGASILRTGRTGDYTLLELDEKPPAGTVLLGWSSSPVAFSSGTPLFRISHPAGSPQAYSQHVVDTQRPTCTSWPRGSWIYSSDTFGGTEGGSSGSPVLNGAGQIVGQLSGACGFNVNDSCDSVENATVDGAFAAYFPEIAQFLDPDASCTDGDNDGFCVSDGDCDDADPAINPGASEVCDDGVDNNCNDLLDEADPACQTSSCDLLPAGGSCVAHSECCSQKCRGRRGAKTCR
jgi:lysyl endopeptidase